jgi:hypothetical protein
VKNAFCINKTRNEPEKKRGITTSEPAQSWETWHKCFGHISYSGLQKILDLNLVNGLNIDTWTPKPDCIPCTEAKQTVELFNESSE